MAAQLLAHRLDLARRDALHVHLDERCHQRLLAPLITAEDLRAEAALAVLWHAQFQSAHAGDEFARVMATAVAHPLIGAFALGCSNGFIHLRLQELLHGELHDSTDQVLVLANYGFEFVHGLLTVLSGHGTCLGSGCLVAPVPTMTRFLFAELSGHYRQTRS